MMLTTRASDPRSSPWNSTVPIRWCCRTMPAAAVLALAMAATALNVSMPRSRPVTAVRLAQAGRPMGGPLGTIGNAIGPTPANPTGALTGQPTGRTPTAPQGPSPMSSIGTMSGSSVGMTPSSPQGSTTGVQDPLRPDDLLGSRAMPDESE